MKQMICVIVVSALLVVACHKKEPQAVPATVAPVVREQPADSCFVAESSVRAGETGILLPAGTRICISKNQLEVKVELPEGFSFSPAGELATEGSGLPFATYGCYCSGEGSTCSVFYSDGLGFGCLQSNCSGSCTGKFTYKGYSVDNVVYQSDKDAFFKMPSVQHAIAEMKVGASYSKQSLYGVSFYLVKDEKTFLPKAACDCEGTAACKLKIVTLQLAKAVASDTKIYYCEGGCNGCELTVK